MDQGHEFYEQGAWQEAIASWSDATAIYQDLGDATAVTGTLLNQAKALEMGGHYRQSCETVFVAIGLEEQSCEVPAEQMTEAIAQRRSERSIALITTEPDPTLQVLKLTTLGNVLRLNGYLLEAEPVLQAAVDIAQTLHHPPSHITTLLTLGKVQDLQYQQALRTAQQTPKPDNQLTALNLAQQSLTTYREAEALLANPSIPPLLQLQTHSQMLALLTHLQTAADSARSPVGWVNAGNPTSTSPNLPLIQEAQSLIPELQAQWQKIKALPLADLPGTQALIDSELSVAQNLVTLWQIPELRQHLGISPATDIVPLLSQVEEEAIALNHPTAQAEALGILGHLYEVWGLSTNTTSHLETAKHTTQAALALAQSAQAPHLAYQWQWQLGRLYRQKTDSSSGTEKSTVREEAIAYYQTAVDSLDAVRQDLLALNPDVRLALRDSVEPLYREFVSLLLEHPADSSPTQVNLRQAVREIDALQLAQLEDFLSCNLTQEVSLDEQEVSPRTAIIYPIILPNQLAVVVQFAESDDLQFYQPPLPDTDIIQTLNSLRQQIERPFLTQTTFYQAQQVYDWLIRPMEASLKAQSIDTLVFVSDGPLRNLPMAVLHDGQQFLVEKYAIALSPSLRLPPSQPLTEAGLKTLAFGLSEMRPDFPPHGGFAPLANVATELAIIQNQVPSENRLNQGFTGNTLERIVQDDTSPVVHLATHGQFSSNPEDTFLLAWDQRITLDDLSQVLSRRSNQSAIELLVLSACKTAAGDSRATLGLAGVAIQSGARSTIASLWNVDDLATAELMGYLYQELASADLPLSRAQALRQAQLALMNNPNFRAPLYWSAFVLVGNWQ